jgi:hypothetical protein
MASFWTFIANTTPSLFPADVQQSVKETVGAINDITLPLNAAQLNPSSSSLTVSQLSALRDRILKTTARVSQLTASEGGASSASSAGSLSSGSSVGTAGSSVGTAGSSVGTAGSSVGTAGSSVGTATPGAPPPANPDVITLDTMKTVNTRVTATILALTNLSSSDTTIVQRISTLGLLKANLEDLITKVQTGAMDLKDVPIKPVDATAFLAALDDKTRPVLPLITPPGANQPPSSNVDSNSTAVLQSLVQSFQTILSTVKFQATYDPATAQNAAVMARLQALEDKLFAYANSATPLPPPILEVIKHELKVLGSIVKVDTSNQARCSPANSLPSISTRLDGDAGTSSTSIMDQLRAAGGASQEAGRGPFLNPVNGPGLTDAQRATRGSAAAFDERTVGGYNYRDRSIEICRQLKVEYGDNETFGCVADPNSVSANYSWKGNYLSVCNRLGDVWGSQGGDKYGCPPFDPSRKFRQS